MHGFGKGTTAALAIAVCRGVVFHIFRLAGFTVHNNVIEYNVAAAGVVIELHLDTAHGVAVVDIVLMAGGQGPISYHAATHTQVNVLATIGAASAHRDGGCPTRTRRA